MKSSTLRRGLWAVAAVGLLASASYLVRRISENRQYFWGPVAETFQAGYREHTVELRDGLHLNFVESPAASHTLPAVLLIPGQGSNWRDYGPVLPALARHFHVVAVDVHGHGNTTWNPADYTATTIAEDLLAFATARFGRSFLVSGHSSGGLIAVQMAATDPAAVRQLVIEDAPFFATEKDRVADTYVGQDNAVLADYLALDQQPDWVTYALPKSYIGELFGGLWPILTKRVLAQREANPQATPNLPWLPPTINRIWESMSHPYDKWWSHAFFISRSWHVGFDQAAALSRVRVPSLFIKASTHYRDGILLAALSDADAQRVDRLLPNNTLLPVTAGHNVHFEQPEWFIRTLIEFSRA